MSICKVDEAGLLVEIFPLAERRTDYTLEWVEAVSAEARKLEDRLSQLRQSIRESARPYSADSGLLGDDLTAPFAITYRSLGRQWRV